MPRYYLDTNTILEFLQRKFAICTQKLMEDIENGKYKAVTSDWCLSEVMNVIKSQVNERNKRDVTKAELNLIKSQIKQMASNYPNLDVISSDFSESESMNTVDVCIQTKDFVPITTAKRNGFILVTKDDRLRKRSKRYGVESKLPREVINFTCIHDCYKEADKGKCKFFINKS